VFLIDKSPEIVYNIGNVAGSAVWAQANTAGPCVGPWDEAGPARKRPMKAIPGAHSRRSHRPVQSDRGGQRTAKAPYRVLFSSLRVGTWQTSHARKDLETTNRTNRPARPRAATKHGFSRQARQERQEGPGDNAIRPWRSLRLCERHNAFSATNLRGLTFRICAREQDFNG